MRAITILSASMTLLGICVAATPSTAAPALSDKPKWEYAEIVTRLGFGSFGSDGTGGIDGFGPGLGGPAHGQWVDERGSKVGSPAVNQPTPKPAPAVPPALRLITSEGEVTAKSWDDLADKLKAPSFKKKDATTAVHKMRVFDKLGAEGWELIDTQDRTQNGTTPGVSSWMFKRKMQ